MREVYRIAHWLPGGSTHYVDSASNPIEERYEFVGRIAEDHVREIYRFKQIGPSTQNPIRYFQPGETLA